MCINRSKLLIILVSHNILRKKVLLFIVESRVWSVECREGRGERGKVVIYTSYFLLIKKVLGPKVQHLFLQRCVKCFSN